MCGITGVVRLDGSDEPAPGLEAMMAAIKHRGPDGEGTERLGACALGHVRLSIIDLSEAGRQPMSNEDGRLWLVFNGEIYNYVELREELSRLGHRFRSRTDSEVILHAWEQWGEGCLERFDGMWAFALWDRVERKLFAARDPFGIKPFYYAEAAGRFLFGSEIKALLADPAVPRDPDRQALYLFLTHELKDHDDRTAFRAVRQLRPGHALVLEQGRVRVWRHWAPEASVADEPPERWAGRFRSLFGDSVRLHLRSDVPVAACLSGGLDSSIVCVEAARRLPYALRTYTVAYPGTAYDESRFVTAMRQRVPALENIQRTPDGTDLPEVIERSVWHFDEPTWSPSTYSWWQLMRLVRDGGSKVVLNGQGSDEMLAGYPLYARTWLRQLLAHGRLGEFAREARIEAARAGITTGQLLRLLAVPLWPAWARRMGRRAGMARSFDESVLGRDFAHEGRPASDRLARKGWFSLTGHLLADFTRTRLPELLHAEDRFSMAFGIESRVPFLERNLVAFLFSLPDEQRLHRGRTKVVLRDAYARDLPQELVDRGDKMGYPTPGEDWMRGSAAGWVNDLLTSARFRDRGFFDAPTVLARWEDARRNGTRWPALWRVVSTEVWARAFLDRSATS